MASTTPDVWTLVRDRRLGLAAHLETLAPERWDDASWCGSWRVRDVLGHLVHVAEGTRVSMTRDIAVNGMRPSRTIDRCARRLGDQPLPELTARLRAACDGRFVPTGLPATTAWGEVVTHGADMLRPLGIDDPIEPSTLPPLLAFYRRIARVAFGTQWLRRVRLVATDVEWSAGQGPVVEGPAADLVLLLAGRSQVAPDLRGDGLPVIDPSRSPEPGPA